MFSIKDGVTGRKPPVSGILRLFASFQSPPFTAPGMRFQGMPVKKGPARRIVRHPPHLSRGSPAVHSFCRSAGNPPSLFDDTGARAGLKPAPTYLHKMKNSHTIT
ncbi:MAG: hypothetical protein E3K32_05150 [wastewater metagenome]|nr:hypothetical protein [Candidatus Loosdrechtia aerotolerans]